MQAVIEREETGEFLSSSTLLEAVRRRTAEAPGAEHLVLLDDGREDLVVVAETRRHDPQELARLATEVRRRVSSAIKVAPDVVELVPPHTVPKTPSGKLRRAESRARFVGGRLTPRRPPVWLQVTRLGAAALAATWIAWVWRGRVRDSPEDPAPDEADANGGADELTV